MRERSKLTAGPWGSNWPSRLVPAPKGMTPTRCSAAHRTTHRTSSSDSAKTTARGGLDSR